MNELYNEVKTALLAKNGMTDAPADLESMLEDFILDPVKYSHALVGDVDLYMTLAAAGRQVAPEELLVTARRMDDKDLGHFVLTVITSSLNATGTISAGLKQMFDLPDSLPEALVKIEEIKEDIDAQLPMLLDLAKTLQLDMMAEQLALIVTPGEQYLIVETLTLEGDIANAMAKEQPQIPKAVRDEIAKFMQQTLFVQEAN